MTDREKCNKLQWKTEESVTNRYKNMETNVKRVVQTLYSVVNSVSNQISVLFGETLLPTTSNFVLNVNQNATNVVIAKRETCKKQSLCAHIAFATAMTTRRTTQRQIPPKLPQEAVATRYLLKMSSELNMEPAGVVTRDITERSTRHVDEDPRLADPTNHRHRRD